MIKRSLFKCFIISALFSIVSNAFAESPFSVSASIKTDSYGRETLEVKFEMPDGHYLYASDLNVNGLEGTVIKPVQMPKPIRKYDKFSESEMDVYINGSVFTYFLISTPKKGPVVEISYQGCNDQMCFMPERIVISSDGIKKTTATSPSESAKTDSLLQGFKIVRRATGYLSTDDFLSFLVSGNGKEETTFRNKAPWMMILLILGGGLLLNLTPCVLPMIPINIAILGAGSQGATKTRGFLLGLMYGLGIAISYGFLGLAVVLAGAKFGVLNASALFNFAVSFIFIVMSLGMFGFINIDFSRYQSGLRSPQSGRGSLLTAFFLGAVAALLAGACVAPVLIWVLVLATDLHASGRQFGLLLPFLLGAGMALPWPFAGAGLAFLPKPGKWMNIVKYAFGTIIFATAIWYGINGYNLAKAGSSGTSPEDLRNQLEQARVAGKPVLIDFWATWCKNCLKMEKTTLKEKAVVDRINRFHFIKFQAEKPQDPIISDIMDKFGVIGLPTYVILEPVSADKANVKDNKE